MFYTREEQTRRVGYWCMYDFQLGVKSTMLTGDNLPFAHQRRLINILMCFAQQPTRSRRRLYHCFHHRHRKMFRNLDIFHGRPRRHPSQSDLLLLSMNDGVNRFID